MWKYCYLLAIVLLVSCNNDDAQSQKAEASGTAQDSLNLNNKVMGIARIEPLDGILDVMAGSSGMVSKIMVEEGQAITSGLILVALDENIEMAQLRQARSRKASQAAIINAENEALAAAKSKWLIAQQNLDFNQKLFESKGITLQELDNKKQEVVLAKDAMQLAETNLLAAKKKLNDNDAEIDYYGVLVNQKTITSGVDGVVLQRLVKKGMYVSPQTALFQVASGPVIAKTEVDELFANKIKIGQEAEIFSQISGELITKGKVMQMSNYLRAKSLFNDRATEQEDRRVREVIISLDDNDQLIGSRVDCVIYLNSK